MGGGGNRPPPPSGYANRLFFRNLNADVESAVRVQTRDDTIVTAARLPLRWNLEPFLPRFMSVVMRPWPRRASEVMEATTNQRACFQGRTKWKNGSTGRRKWQSSCVKIMSLKQKMNGVRNEEKRSTREEEIISSTSLPFCPSIFCKEPRR